MRIENRAKEEFKELFGESKKAKEAGPVPRI